ncbi:MAG: cell wall-active antibiotics response protein [Bacteroidales bacterium]|nr:cell wall-active antibiotics response protein [Bacteroidales bacterium]
MRRRTIVGIIFMVVALLKLADMWGIVSLDGLWNPSWDAYVGPLLILYIGIELVISSYRHHPDQWLQRPIPPEGEGKRICCSVRYGGDQYIYHGEVFHGARLDAFCGGIQLDLREAVITENEEIDIHTFMGGVELFVPRHVNVIVKSRSFIGGVSNDAAWNALPGIPCLHISASNFFGGVSIKDY